MMEPLYVKKDTYPVPPYYAYHGHIYNHEGMCVLCQKPSSETNDSPCENMQVPFGD